MRVFTLYRFLDDVLLIWEHQRRGLSRKEWMHVCACSDMSKAEFPPRGSAQFSTGQSFLEGSFLIRPPFLS